MSVDPNDYPLTVDVLTLSAKVEAIRATLVEAKICTLQELNALTREMRGFTRLNKGD